MARITVEDCLEQVDNRFNLVLIASKRARQISHGKEPKVELEHDKPTVVALREIAAGLTTADILHEEEVDPMDAFEIVDEALTDLDDDDLKMDAKGEPADDSNKTDATESSNEE